MDKLKKNVFDVIKKFESNENFPETIGKQVPMGVLLVLTSASLIDMKKVINELINEKKILFFTDDFITRSMKSFNQNLPTRKALLKQPTEDELFVCGYVIDIRE